VKHKQADLINNSLEIRCQCSRLLFKKYTKNLEVKCPRCKRIHVFTLEQLTRFLEAGNFCALHNPSLEARDLESNAQKTRKEEFID
jgi:phage FluMu protein Com